MPSTKRIAVIFGGKSVEHEISIISAKSILNNLDKRKYIPVPIFIDKKGVWRKAVIKNSELAVNRKSYLTPLVRSNKPALLEIAPNKYPRRIHIDCAFPILHGTYGEDGAIQGLFEIMNTPYVGANVHGSAIGMDKISMKSVLKDYGIPVVDFTAFDKGAWENSSNSLLGKIRTRIGFPCFVKSANLGSSIGITKAETNSDLKKSIEYSLRFSDRILVEKAVKDPREIEVSVLGNNNPMASVPGEIVPKRGFYDYEAKYSDDSTELIAPAKLNKSVTKKLQEIAVDVFKALDCSGMGRIDFLMERKTKRIYVSEINTIPGFTQISMYPKLWELSGIKYKKLVTTLIELAIDKHEEKNKLNTDYELKLKV
ncbi:MAG: D-alanine--D-alanine ligase [Candidatus Dadabacteria bacterium]|nr:D-alanine--D-alanine ligase [Candidatus Dadabacteria bacterium]NIS07879.1 D-alanine--D-alanine ligase [Candidatus Dadabacteria bacterium]NIV42899.1 D-alanine--D-alanine ligase [Candidatus Dadabacteria bacterium]NIX14869.1 D-alanine--D-alanine ligase [Candidatus Dadabacteria bacterium]NIY21483.1 D-alanine--D-alanine ligase [Candidatus Dadabacteria bacterium]